MMRLLDFIFPPRSDEAVLRNTPDEAFYTLIDPRVIPATQPGTVSLLPFADPRVRAAIHEAKYHGNKRSFGLLGGILAEYLRDADEIRSAATLVPIPLGRTRRKKRGFNQAEEIVRCAVKELGLTIDTRVIGRVRETASQVSLPRRAREENMRGAFAPLRSADPASTYILVDDVTTTGATLQAAVDALRAAGAVYILPVALAHAD